MTTVDDRHKSFERKFERDQDLQFKVNARRNKLLGLWAAGVMARATPRAMRRRSSWPTSRPGHDDVMRKPVRDLAGGNAASYVLLAALILSISSRSGPLRTGALLGSVPAAAVPRSAAKTSSAILFAKSYISWRIASRALASSVPSHPVGSRFSTSNNLSALSNFSKESSRSCWENCDMADLPILSSKVPMVRVPREGWKTRISTIVAPAHVIAIAAYWLSDGRS
jgi:hypothetical protein